MTVEEATEAGWLLWKCSAQIKTSLETCKGVLREHALLRSKGEPGPLIFSGPGQVSCKVTLQEPSYQIRNEADILDLRESLPPEVYQDCFEERTTVGLRPGFQEFLFSQLTDEDQKALILAALDIDTPPPRVSFGASK